ncbi:MAG: 4Fe-4S dicluster domain-containing protein [Eggerthellaceae bacterium]|nr:4Fe-4S dicluster domain-containing protein [Eggerthellaceae bacterium]
MADKRLNRRDFLIGAGLLAGSIVVGAGVNVAVAYADVLRPPGSLDEEEFIARCIRCERCISICPTDIIEPLGIEENVLAVRTPILNFENDYCIYCDKCRQVCPTGAIAEVDPFDAGDARIGCAAVVTDQCLAYLSSGSCGVCVDVCPYDALSLSSEHKPVVDESKCNGCGACVKRCPANVMTSFSGDKIRGIHVYTEKQLEEVKQA